MIRNEGERFVRRRQTGMTLMELLTVVVIVGILSSIALPTYRNYVVRTNRTEIKAALLETAARLERCFTQSNAYNSAPCTQANVERALPSGNYRIVASTFEVDEFVLRGEPLGNQKGQDKACGVFVLNSRNQRTTDGGTQTPDQCWGR